MNTDLQGINEGRLDKLILELYDYSDKISDTLSRIEDVMTLVNKEFKCSCSKNLMTKFNNLKENFPTVKENVLEYANDLTKVKNNYSDFMVELKKRIQNDIMQDLKIKNYEERR